MLKVLVKKQFAELFHQMFRKSAMGKRGKGGKGSVILYGLLFVYLFAMLTFLFFSMSGALCAPLCDAGLDWLYFALMGIMTTVFGVIGSVFTTYSSLYQSKDNELLLSMPIPPGVILFSRMITVYLLGFLFEAVAWIPTVIQYFRTVGITLSSAVAGTVLLFVLPLLALVLSCILGWVIALISARIPHNRSSAITVLISLALIAVYYYICTKAYSYLQLILLNSETISSKVRIFLYPFYQMGCGAAGSLSSLLIFIAMVLAAFAVVELILSRSFIKLTTSRKGAVKVRYREKSWRSASPDRALLRKELMRFTGSATYMLNCGLGLVFMVVLVVFALVKRTVLFELLAFLPAVLTDALPLIACALLASLSSMNTITAPSVSLEGSALWLVRSLPVTPWQVLRAKLRLHLLLVGIPTVFSALVLVLLLRPGLLFSLLIPLFSLLFAVFCAELGLLLGLRFPNLSYTNESVAVKQGLSVTLAMFLPWGVLAALVLLYVLLRTLLTSAAFLLLAAMLVAAAAFLLLHILKTKGTSRFLSL